MLDQSQIAQELSHVLWIAGSPCSGKSTISHTITRIYVFLDYHVDAEEQQLPLYEADGSRSLEEMTELVERHFDLYLIQHFGRHKPA